MSFLASLYGFSFSFRNIDTTILLQFKNGCPLIFRCYAVYVTIFELTVLETMQFKGLNKRLVTIQWPDNL